MAALCSSPVRAEDLGWACVFTFADEGCAVVLPARRKDEFEWVAERIRAKGR